MQSIAFNGTEFIQSNHNTPLPKGFDLLVEIKAISVNPIDTKIRQTIAPEDKTSKVLGYDASGVVVAVGDKVTQFKTGDQVFYAGDVTREGSNATHQLVDERIVGHKPKSLDFNQSAALPLTAITAWESLFDRLRLGQNDKDKTLLLIGAAGGVGSIATQLAKKVIGMKVVATASRSESQDWCKKMGADVVFDHKDLPSQFQEKNLKVPNFILCMGHPDIYFETMAELIAPQGLICVLPTAGRDYDLNLLKNKSAGFVWEFMFARPMFKTDDMIKQHEILEKVASLVDAGEIQTTLGQILSPINIDNINQAHELIEKGSMIGKMVITNE